VEPGTGDAVPVPAQPAAKAAPLDFVDHTPKAKGEDPVSGVVVAVVVVVVVIGVGGGCLWCIVVIPVAT